MVRRKKRSRDPLIRWLERMINREGSIRTCRISRADKHRHANTAFSWGVARYEVRLDARGKLTNTPDGGGWATERPRYMPDEFRDAHRLVMDLHKVSLSENRAVFGQLGPVNATAVVDLLNAIGDLKPSVKKTLEKWVNKRRGKLEFKRYHPYGDERDRARFLNSRDEERRLIYQACSSTALPKPTRVHGIMTIPRFAGSSLAWSVHHPNLEEGYGSTPREALMQSLATHHRNRDVRRYGSYRLVYVRQTQYMEHPRWVLRHTKSPYEDIFVWARYPTRRQLAREIRRHRPQLPSRLIAPELGVRGWFYDSESGGLISPNQHTPWFEATLIEPNFKISKAVRGDIGIHAITPARDWRKTNMAPHVNVTNDTIIGLVERSGKYVAGEGGWRAERATIRALLAQRPEQAMALAERYKVPVYIMEADHV